MLGFNVHKGGANVIKSIQYVEQTFTASLTSTASISSVDLNNSIILPLGIMDNSAAGGQLGRISAYLDFVSNSTVRATRGDTSLTPTWRAAVIEFESAVISSVQRGTISMTNTVLTNTASITEVSANAVLLSAGFTGDYTSSEAAIMSILELDDTTTVRATREASNQNATHAYQVVDFN